MIQIPECFYGTAWKEDETPRLTFQALHAGFRAIDTANQRKHYFEEGVGIGLRKYYEAKGIVRSDLFLQTKFTYLRGQDHRLPYEKSASFTDQVAQSFASSLKHLSTDYLDSYVLHGPYSHEGVTEPDRETWAAMESLLKQKKVRHLGISNASAAQLVELCSIAKFKPTFVQNRCYARDGWDQEVRKICREHGIYYQGFSLLTANQKELSSSAMQALSHLHSKTIPQIIFRFCKQIGIVWLTGTNSPLHMKQDLDIQDFHLSEEEIKLIERVSS